MGKNNKVSSFKFGVLILISMFCIANIFSGCSKNNYGTYIELQNFRFTQATKQEKRNNFTEEYANYDFITMYFDVVNKTDKTITGIAFDYKIKNGLNESIYSSDLKTNEKILPKQTLTGFYISFQNDSNTNLIEGNADMIYNLISAIKGNTVKVIPTIKKVVFE